MSSFGSVGENGCTDVCLHLQGTLKSMEREENWKNIDEQYKCDLLALVQHGGPVSVSQPLLLSASCQHGAPVSVSQSLQLSASCQHAQCITMDRLAPVPRHKPCDCQLVFIDPLDKFSQKVGRKSASSVAVSLAIITIFTAQMDTIYAQVRCELREAS